jgi:hypothetical protein
VGGGALERRDRGDLTLVDEEEEVVAETHVRLELRDDLRGELGTIARFGRDVLEADLSLRIEAVEMDRAASDPKGVVKDDLEASSLEAALEGRNPLRL